MSSIAADAAALADLHADLVRFARAELFTRHLDPQLAEDVVEDAVVKWFGGRIQYKSPSQVRAWMKTVITRLVVDRIRRPGRDILDLPGVYSLSEPWARGG